MSAVATKSKKKTQEWLSKDFREKIDLFIRDFTVPFAGTIEKPYNLSSVSENQKRPTEDDIVRNLPSVEEYLKNRKSSVVDGKYDVILIASNLRSKNKASPLYDKIISGIKSYNIKIGYVDKKTNLVYSDDYLNKHSFSNFSSVEISSIIKDKNGNKFLQTDVLTDISFQNSRYYKEDVPAGLLTETLILNADEEAEEHQVIGFNSYTKKLPCLSFSCLANLLANKVIGNTYDESKIIGSHKIKIVDFSPEEEKNISAKDKKSLAKSRKSMGEQFNFNVWASSITPPSKGFTLINYGSLNANWHKSPTVVLSSKNKSYLMGQDEGTYFGCILSDNPKSLDAAYTSLMPKNARNKKGVLRQGEWFAIPVNEKEIPEIGNPNIIIYHDSLHQASDPAIFTLPIEDKDSNTHSITAKKFIVTKDGRFYIMDFSITHNEHESMIGKKDQWYTIEKNTAIASYSAEKVD